MNKSVKQLIAEATQSSREAESTGLASTVPSNVSGVVQSEGISGVPSAAFTPTPNYLPRAPLPSAHQAAHPRRFIVSPEPAAIGPLIDDILSRSGLKQAEVCRRLGIHDTTLQQYRNGRRQKPSVYWLNRFVQACGGRLLVELTPIND